MRFAGSAPVLGRVHRRVGTLAAAASIALAALATSTAIATPAFASPSGDLASLTNQARAVAGLPALQVTGDLNAVAQRWAQHLAAANALSHNPGLASQVSNWTVLGENVGMAGDIPSVQKAFMASPHHRDNILDPRFTQMGVGSATSIYPSCGCQVLWVVVDFRRPETAAAPAAPAPAKPAPAPARPAPAKPASPAQHAPTSATSATSHHASSNPPAPAGPPAGTPAAPSVAASPAAASASALRTQLVAAASAPAGAAAASDPVSRLLSFASDVAS